MKKLILCIAIFLGTFLGSAEAKSVRFTINTDHGFSTTDGSLYAIVEFPGKSAHDIYNMMATNIGLWYYQPQEVMYGVEDRFISVTTSESNFCSNGSQTWSAQYFLKFLIKDGKVLVLSPKVREVSANYSTKMKFTEFITKYWYDSTNQTFIESEQNNMILTEIVVNSTINTILGIISIDIVPDQW